MVAGILADGYAIGAISAQAQVDGSSPNPDDWTPGDTAQAKSVAEQLGLSAALGLLLGGGSHAAAEGAGGTGIGGGGTDATAEDMGDGYLSLVSRVLAGWDPDVAADELGNMLDAAVADGAYAEAVTVTQITAASGQAALDRYLQNTTSLIQWVTERDARVCPTCLANEAQGPIPAGTAFQSGDLRPPAHGRCRCGIVPSWLAQPPDLPGEDDAAGDLADAGEADEAAEEEEAESGEAAETEEAVGGEEDAAEHQAEPEAEADVVADEGEEAREAETAGGEAEGAEAAPEERPFEPLEFASNADAREWLADHTPDLPPDQAEAVDWYTGPGAYEANASLRDGTELPADVAAQVAALDSAMSGLPADLTLTRGVWLEGFPGGEDGLPSLAGQLISDEAFMSTSVGAVAGDVGGDLVMHIAAPQGTMAVITGTLSGAQGQREVVLARGTRLAVAEVEQDEDGVWQMWVTVVPGE